LGEIQAVARPMSDDDYDFDEVDALLLHHVERTSGSGAGNVSLFRLLVPDPMPRAPMLLPC
jgi:hypothetical protein